MMYSRLQPQLKLLGREILDLFYPRDCVNTGNPLPGENKYRYLSEASLNEIHWAKGPACATCGLPFAGFVQGRRLCPNCKELEPVFSSGKTAFMLKGPTRKLIHELKYHNGFHLLPDILELVKEVPGYIGYMENAILVPVPLHKSKLKKRGFNQSLLLAQALAKVVPNAQVMELLKRVKQTKSQTFLRRDERVNNVKNAFALLPKYAINKSLRYVIIDDVFTTGATLNACAATLRKNGASNINILTLGHG